PIARECNIAMSLKHAGKQLPIDFQVKADHFHTATWPLRKIDNNIMLQVTPDIVIQTGLFYSDVKVKGLQDTNLKMSLAYPGRTVKFEEKFNQLPSKAYENHVSLQWHTNQAVNMNTVFKKTSEVFTVENEIILPGKKTIKVSSNVNMKAADCSANVELQADAGLFTDRAIKCQAKAALKYQISRSANNIDAMFELDMGPSVGMVMFTCKHDAVVGKKSTTSYLLKTPFAGLKMYKELIETTTMRNKIRYNRNIEMKSYGYNNNIKMNMELDYENQMFDYTSNMMINGVNTDIKLSLANGAYKKACELLVKHGKETPLISLKMDHSIDRRQVTTDLTLNFDMFDASGNLKFDSASDSSEVTSNGNWDLKMPRHFTLNRFNGMYAVKHNEAVSEIKADYSSSVSAYRNGKLEMSVSKNLPRALKGNMLVSHLNRDLVNIEAQYKNNRDNHDIKAEMTVSGYQPLSTSFNVDMSGDRKTSRAELRSGSVVVSVDGAVEVRADRFYGGEVTLGYGGRSMFVKGDYQREGSSHKISANIGEPNGQKISMKASFNNAANKKSLSFNVDTTNIRALHSVDVELTVRPDRYNPMVEASVEAKPHFDKCTMKASANRGPITEATIEVASPFDFMRQAKAMVSMGKEGRRSDMFSIKTSVNNKKVFNMKGVYNMKDIRDLNAKITASTSHRRYDELLFDFTHKGEEGNWWNLDSSVEMKVGRDFEMEASLKNNQYKTDILSKINMRNMIDWESKFVRDGLFDDMTIKMSHNCGSSGQYSADMTINGYGKMISLQLSAPHGVKMDWSSTVNPRSVHFNIESLLQLSSSATYKFSTTYDHLTKLSAKFSSPSSNGELMMSSSDNLRSFKVEADFTHSYNRKYQLTFSNVDVYKQVKLSVMTPSSKNTLDFSLTGDLHMFQLDVTAKHNNNVYKMSASNKQIFRKINVNVISPMFEARVQMDNNLKNLNGVWTLDVNRKTYQLSYSNKDYYEQLNLSVSSPEHSLVASSNVDVKKSGVSGDASVVFNGHKISLDGSYKVMGQKKMVKANLKTPYFNDNLSASVSGKLKKFKVTAKLQHNKDVYEVVASNKAYYKTINVGIYLPEGNKIKLDFEGELQKFKLFTSAFVSAGNGQKRQQYKFVMSNQNYLKGVNVELSTPTFGNMEWRFDVDGNMRNFYLNNQFLWRQNEYSMSLASNVLSHDYSISVVLPMFVLKASTKNCFETTNFLTKLIFDKATVYQVAASNVNYFDELSFNMTTPQFGHQSLLVQIAKEHTVYVRLENNGEVYEYNFNINERGLTASFSSSDNKGELKVKYEDPRKDFTVNAKLTNKGNTYTVKAVNDNYRLMSVRVVSPNSDDVDIKIDNTGDMKDGKNRVRATFGEYSFESSGNFQLNHNLFLIEMKPIFKSKRSTVSLNFNLQSDFITKLTTQSVSVNVNGRKSSLVTRLDLSRGIVGSFSLTDPYMGEIELSINADPIQLDKIKSSIMLRSAFTGDIKAVYEHSLSQTRFGSKAHIERGSNLRVLGYQMEVNFQDKYTYDANMDYNNRKYNIHVKGALNEYLKTMSVQVKSPHHDMTLSAESQSNRILKVSLTLPRQYYAAKMSWNKGNTVSTELELNLDTSDKMKQFKIDMSYVNADDRSQMFRQTTVKVSQQDITLTSYFHVKKTYNMYQLKGEFSWGEEENQKLGAELHIKTGNTKGVTLHLTSPSRNTIITGSLQSNNGQHNIMLAITPDTSRRNNKISVEAAISSRDNSHKVDLTLGLPNQRNGLKVNTVFSGSRGNTIFSLRTQVSVDQDPRQTLTLDAKLNNNNNNNYTLEVQLEQPSSNLAHGMVAFVSASPRMYSSGVEMTYMSAKRQQYNMLLRGEINRLRKTMNVEVMYPRKHIQLSGSVQSSDQYSVTLNKKENGMKDMQASAAVSRDIRSAHLQMNYDQTNPNKVYHLKANVANNKKIAVKSYRSVGQKVNKDGRLTIELRPYSVLFTQLIWNPDLLNEINDYSYAMLEHYGMQMKQMGDKMAEFLSEEVESKSKLMRKSFGEHYTAIDNFLSAEFDFLSQDVAKHARKMGQFYQRDSFYVKTAHQSAMGAWDSLWESYQQDINNMRRQLQEFNWWISSRMDQAKMAVDRFFVHLDDYYVMYSQEVRRIADNLTYKIGQIYRNRAEHFDTVKRQIDMYASRALVMAKRLHRQLKAHPMTQTVTDYTEQVFTSVSDWMAKQQIKHLGLAVYQKAKAAYDYWQVEETLMSLKNQLEEYVEKKINTFVDAMTQLRMRSLTFDPRNGQIAVELRYKSLVTIYNTVKSLVDGMSTVKMMVSKYLDMLPASFWSPADIYYTLKYYSSPYNWVPPFEATASVYGSHILTFDGRHINFMGTCSHTLVSSEGNFKVVVNYSPNKQERTIQSVTVLNAAKEEVTIDRTGRVRYNGRVVKQPFFSTSDFNVYLSTHDGAIYVKGSSGYTVEAHPNSGFYMVHISGWYFNRVAGLMGTYTYEESDDLVTPYKYQATDIEEFANSWAVTSCQSRNYAQTVSVPQENYMCDSLFRSTASPFRNCFKQVNPDHFYDVCQSQAYTHSGPLASVQCELSSYYINACHYTGVYLDTLGNCCK
ncbi:uncharacterized protein LOC115226724, partial [Argonauta hians]